jgi:membrane associated rhomboid family serine protease
MFMHAIFEADGTLNISHILFNMFGLFMFGSMLENVWGPKRFLTFYLITGVGAALIYLGYEAFQYHPIQLALQDFTAAPSPSKYIAYFQNHYSEIFNDPSKKLMINQFTDAWAAHPLDVDFATNAINSMNQLLNQQFDIPMVGASGAIFGILVGFGMLFPNTELIMLFFPVPIKAKYAVVLYAGLELFLGVAQFSGDNVAHFAHLGGALFGFILVKYWQRNSNRFY